MRLDTKEDAAKLRLKILESGVGLLRELIADGPYQNDDGECSFCSFAPNDSEDLEHLIAHKKDCLWRRSKEYLAALGGGEGTGEGK